MRTLAPVNVFLLFLTIIALSSIMVSMNRLDKIGRAHV